MQSLLTHFLNLETFKEHETGGQGCFELVRDIHLIVDQVCILVFLLDHLAFKLERLNVMRDVVEVDGDCTRLQEVYAFHSNLSVLILLRLVLIKRIYATSLCLSRLIELGSDYLIEVERSFFH